jgi:hypothetical protein
MSSQHASSTKQDFNKLIQFRQAAYGLLGKARDAQFELTDAVIQMRQIQSFVELSCAPAFRRKWSSAYEAIQDGRPDRAGLLQLYLKQLAADQGVVLVGDHTAWPRLWAEKLEGRSYQHQPTPIPGRRPVTIGHGYSTLVVVPEPHRSWALPLLHERISDQKPVEKGAQQLRQVCERLKIPPLSIWDSEYGCATFLLATAGVRADILLRLRTNLCLEGPTKAWKGRGQHPKHGLRFKFKDPTTWWPPDQEVDYSDADFGPLKVKIWHGLRFKQALERRMDVAYVERLQAPGTRRKPKILWFAWVGETLPTYWWSQYNQRYPVDHWYRFAKGRLHWTLPLFATPQQAQRWSDLMPFLTWELWLARELVADKPLPWQKSQTILSPGRVCQGMQNILVAIGTPTGVCKSRGKAPGWPTGMPRAHRKPFELVRSEQWKTIRERQKAKTNGQPGKRGRPKKIRDPVSA